MQAIASVERPGRQGHIRHCLAGRYVLRDPARNLLPACGLPGFEWTKLPAIAPADREVHLTRRVGDRSEVIRTVVEQVAEDRPQELRLGMGGRPQCGKLLRGIADLQGL